MKILVKLKVFLLAITIIFATESIAAETILPIPKPEVDKEIKIKTAKKKLIYPKEKPKEKKVKTADTQEIDQTTQDESEAFIYPENKPIIVVKKVNKSVKKSSILSKKDFATAKAVFKAIDKNKWQTALKLSKKAKDKSLYKLVNYLYLKKSFNSASFYDYYVFINNNPNYPRINRLRYLAEHKINLNQIKPSTIIKWFDGKPPLSEFGKIKLGEIYVLQGKNKEGAQLIKEGWIKAKLSKSDLRYLRKKYKKIITVEDNIKRVDWHAWEGKYWDVQRMLRYLPKVETALYRARQLLMSRS